MFRNDNQEMKYLEFYDTKNESISHQNIINQDNYCDLVSETIKKKGLKKVVYSDLPPDQSIKELIQTYYKSANIDQFIGMNRDTSPYRYLESSITLFYSSLQTWHKHHKIGKNFLCEGQIYNHILNSQALFLSSGINNTVYSYKAVDMSNRVLETWDLSDIDQCQEFTRNFNGQWSVKSIDKKANLIEITEKTGKEFRKATKDGEKCPFPNRYAQKVIRTAEFIMNGYALLLVSPYKVYFAEGIPEFFSFSEYLNAEKIKKSYSEEIYNEIITQMKITIVHYFNMNFNKIVKHPRTFEVFQFKFIVKHDYMPVLYDISPLTIFDSYYADIRKIIQFTHIHAIEIAYYEILGIPFEKNFTERFVEIF
ncbi:hypothetical protein SteCoe_17600 [Stentor coeruleus]|uniref:Uncharacterized protein n=1 Tax=Stentor coeruleus TaxID=5963 RepID=A0A1R2BYW7_9CILI|nr:hypothetical protein SteCoe_17600 [Stentor coeruleus]